MCYQMADLSLLTRVGLFVGLVWSQACHFLKILLLLRLSPAGLGIRAGQETRDHKMRRPETFIKSAHSAGPENKKNGSNQISLCYFRACVWLPTLDTNRTRGFYLLAHAWYNRNVLSE